MTNIPVTLREVDAVLDADFHRVLGRNGQMYYLANPFQYMNFALLQFDARDNYFSGVDPADRHKRYMYLDSGDQVQGLDDTPLLEGHVGRLASVYALLECKLPGRQQRTIFRSINVAQSREINRKYVYIWRTLWS